MEMYIEYLTNAGLLGDIERMSIDELNGIWIEWGREAPEPAWLETYIGQLQAIKPAIFAVEPMSLAELNAIYLNIFGNTSVMSA